MSWIVIALVVIFAFAAYYLASEWLVRRQREHGREDLPSP